MSNLKLLTNEVSDFIKKEKYSLKSYCLEVLGKKDLVTGEAIKYDYYDKYLMQDFNDKRNLAKYLKTLDDPSDYINKKIDMRSERDGWSYFPSQVELRSLFDLPAINVMIDVGYKFDNSLPQKYDYTLTATSTQGGFEYLVDTREQKPLKLKKTTPYKLAYGDYCAHHPLFNNIFVERKSIEDLWGTLGAGYPRFIKEVERVDSDGAYLVVMVEYKIGKALSYNYAKKFTKTSSGLIFKRIREVMQSFDCVQFIFTGGRAESTAMLDIIYTNAQKIRNMDLQFQLDTKGIKLCGK